MSASRRLLNLTAYRIRSDMLSGPLVHRRCVTLTGLSMFSTQEPPSSSTLRMISSLVSSSTTPDRHRVTFSNIGSRCCLILYIQELYFNRIHTALSDSTHLCKIDIITSEPDVITVLYPRRMHDEDVVFQGALDMLSENIRPRATRVAYLVLFAARLYC